MMEQDVACTVHTRRHDSAPDDVADRGTIAEDRRVRTLRTVVRGFVFSARPGSAVPPTAGDTAVLMREADNPRDPYAVAIWTAGQQPWRVGYLDRSVAVRLAPDLDGGVVFRATFDGWLEEPSGRWMRPVIAIDERALLPGAPRAARRPGGASAATSDCSTTTAATVETKDIAAEAPVRLWGRPPGVRRTTVGQAKVGQPRVRH